MEAKRCDVCMHFYLPNEGSGTIGVSVKENYQEEVATVGRPGGWSIFSSMFGDQNPSKTLDLCPECMGHFQEWISVLRENAPMPGEKVDV